MNIILPVHKVYLLLLHWIVFMMILVVIFVTQYLNKLKRINLELSRLLMEANSVTKELENKCARLQENDKRSKCLAYYDGLTKLPNKTSFSDKLCEIITSNSKSAKFALLFIDIDRFKEINHTLGHHYGDQLLVLITAILQNMIPPACTLYRWCGDEFVIIYEDFEDKLPPAKVAENVLAGIRPAFEIDGKKAHITLSIGIALYPEDGCTLSDIIKSAEIAMYNSKDSGRNQYAFYTKETHTRLCRKSLIEKHLRTAIENEEFTVLYQPKYSLISREIVGYEALLRWDNEELGQVSPMEFIPVAEESGLILFIGNWVLKTACLQNAQWVQEGICYPVAVNISPMQFEQSNFSEVIQNILRETKLLPQYLELEITETILIKSVEKSIRTIKSVKEVGVGVSLDDFGTGYSCLNYLKLLPINSLKIDKSFIDDLSTCKSSRTILQGIVQLAHTMNLEVIAEGVETANQREILKEIGCDIVQGFYFSKPKSCREIGMLVKHQGKYKFLHEQLSSPSII